MLYIYEYVLGCCILDEHWFGEEIRAAVDNQQGGTELFCSDGTLEWESPRIYVY